MTTDQTVPRGTADADEPVTWIAPQPSRFSAGELMRRAGVGRLGRYDLERVDEESGPLFHSCGYLYALHDNTRAGRPLPFGCPSESDARMAFGDQ